MISENPTLSDPLVNNELSELMNNCSIDYKGKTYDMSTIITRANVKKYIVSNKLNFQFEEWLKIINKLDSNESLTTDESNELENIKIKVDEYIFDKMPKNKRNTFNEKPENQKLNDVVKSMKYKFSVDAFEVITHTINLCIQEILSYSFEECCALKLKTVKSDHIPWQKLKDKLLAGIYFNTLIVNNQINSQNIDDSKSNEETENIEEPVETTEDNDESEDKQITPQEKKIKLKQYISTTFKVLSSNDERFNTLKLGRSLSEVLNELIFQSLDRYANILNILLEASDSKTVSCKFALYATRYLLSDHLYATDEKTRSILHVLEDRIDRLDVINKEKKENRKNKSASNDTENTTTVSTTETSAVDTTTPTMETPTVNTTTPTMETPVVDTTTTETPTINTTVPTTDETTVNTIPTADTITPGVVSIETPDDLSNVSSKTSNKSSKGKKKSNRR